MMKFSKKQWIILGVGSLAIVFAIVCTILWFTRKPANNTPPNDNLFSREVSEDWLLEFEAAGINLDDFEKTKSEVEERGRYRKLQFKGKDFVIAAYSYYEDPGRGGPCAVSYYSTYLERDGKFYTINFDNAFSILYGIMEPDSTEAFADLVNVYYKLFNPWCGVQPLLFLDTKYWELEHDQGSCEYDPIDVGGSFKDDVFTYYIQDSGAPYSVKKISLTRTGDSLDYSSEDLYTCEEAGAIF